MLLEQLRQRLGFEGASAGEDFVEDEAERVDIAPDGDLLSAQLLGRHIGRRAGPNVRDLADRRQAEVHDPDPARAVEHDVRRLQIAVQHAALVRGGESRADLPRDLEPLVFRQPADAAEQDREILAVHVLHRDEQLAVDLPDVVHAADVRMRHGPRGPHLVVELREPHRVAQEIRRQEFQRDLLPEAQVVGAIDLSHAAAPEQAQHAISVVEHHARAEASVIDRSRTGQPAARRRGRPWRSGRQPGRFVAEEHRDIRHGGGPSAAGAEAAARRQRGLAMRTGHGEGL